MNLLCYLAIQPHIRALGRRWYARHSCRALCRHLPPPLPAALCCLALVLCGVVGAQPTPPVMPKIQEVSLPPPVELPGPEALPADVPNRPITAAEAAAIALHNQPSLAAARAAIAAARARTRQAQSDLGPVVGVTATLTGSEVNGTTSSSGKPTNFVFGASVKQLLYDYNHTRDLVRQVQAQESVAGANLTVTQAELVLQVKQAFYACLQATRLVAVSEANVTNQKQHVAMAEARLNSGLGLPYDVVRAQTAYSDAVYGLSAARNTAARSRVALAELIGLDPRTPLVPAEAGEAAAAADVQQAVGQALAQRPEMTQARAAVTAAELAVTAARTTNAPTVTGAVAVTQRGDDFFPDANILSASVALQWNPFDSGYTRARVQEAEANLAAAQAQVQARKLQVTADVSAAYLDLRTAEQRVTTAQAQVANAGEALRLAEGRYRAGIGTFIDVLDAQTALDVASTNQVNARTAVDLARAAFARAQGSDLPGLL